MNKVAAFALRRKNSVLSMSEKMFCPPQPLRLVWITPACAGKRRSDWIIRSIYWDHPRVCGEKRFNFGRSVTDLGSPPRMRGKAQIPLPICPATGITPAHAGKRPMMDSSAFSTKDHPRACGEKRHRSSSVSVAPGSPPRMRGKVSTDGLYPTFARITPAYAGKSCR